jgi:diguanylate cyclase (GGDEF)-like protein
VSKASNKTMRVSMTGEDRLSGPPSRKRGSLLVVSDVRLGMLIPIDAEVTIGRSDEALIVLDDESLSRRHARFFPVHGAFMVQDLGSTNGTLVNGLPITEPRTLADGDQIQLGVRTLLRFSLQDDLEFDASRKLYEATVRDGLTGVFNRHFLDERLQSEFAFARRHGTPLSLLMLDADHFKRVNDTHGHPAGDEVLRRIAAALTEMVRTEDVVARYGGEEFVLLLRATPMELACGVAERIRASIELLQIDHGGTRIPVTVSIGLACQRPERNYDAASGLLASADAALYQAKENGRNRVFIG